MLTNIVQGSILTRLQLGKLGQESKKNLAVLEVHMLKAHVELNGLVVYQLVLVLKNLQSLALSKEEGLSRTDNRAVLHKEVLDGTEALRS